MQRFKNKFGLVILLLFVLFTLTACSSTSNTSSGGNNASEAEKIIYQLNQDVIVDEKVRWKVLEASDLGQELRSTNQFIDSKTTTGKFIKVRFEVENLTSDMSSISSLELEDGKGRRFNTYSEDYSFIPENESYILENLNPNVPKVFSSIYEVPQDATELKFVASDLNIFAGGEALIELGF